MNKLYFGGAIVGLAYIGYQTYMTITMNKKLDYILENIEEFMDSNYQSVVDDIFTEMVEGIEDD